jgi:hypothetical protein
MPAEIPKVTDLAQRVFNIRHTEAFEMTALDVFRFQYSANEVYQSYCTVLKKDPAAIKSIFEIPFLPISFFKTHNVMCGEKSITGSIFESSGTTGQQRSRHLVQDIHLYESSFRRTFTRFYGNVEDYCILGLLPSYLERKQSSLVYMVADLIKQSGHAKSGFYLYDFETLAKAIAELEGAGQKTILLGVTYALLDFAERYPMPLQHTIIMETGGMKGRKQEWLRQEVHDFLKKSFSISSVHSEYGMTELLSQAYATADGHFQPPAWMQVLIREEDDPFSLMPVAKSGGINVIDLANIWSCAFIATEDVGRLHPDGRFEVAGRLDNAEIRGCSLLAL